MPGKNTFPTSATAEDPSQSEVRARHRSRSLSSSDCGSKSTDAMGTVEGGALRLGLIGTSSSAYFMRQMRETVDGKELRDLGNMADASSFVSTDRLRRHHKWEDKLHSSAYVLPPRATADRLMDVYWNYGWIIFPFLNKVQIMQCYENLWIGGQSQSISQQVFHCILNTCFALACELDPEMSPSEKGTSSKVYFARARELLIVDLFSMSELNMVQALLLMSQFLQSTEMPRQCYQTVGWAIWIAQVRFLVYEGTSYAYPITKDLGPHLRDTILSIEEQSQRELVLRVWQGCVVMDT